MRVLLVESEPEDVLFLQDVLIEIGEGRHWDSGYRDSWTSPEILHAASWQEASEILSKEPVDIVLLDLDLSDSQGMETLRRAQNAAQATPMVLLVAASERSLGVRLVRAGAEDFLVKKEVDCAPLAHSIRCAIERHRVLTAARADSTRDALTGLLNRPGFLASAGRDRHLAERLGSRMLIMVAEPKDMDEIAAAYGEQRRDLTLMEAADSLRGLTGPADLLARVEPHRFAMAIFETPIESAEAARMRIHSASNSHRIRFGAAMNSAENPSTIEALLMHAAADMSPGALAMRT